MSFQRVLPFTAFIAVLSSFGLAAFCLDRSSPQAPFQVSNHVGLPFICHGLSLQQLLACLVCWQVLFRMIQVLQRWQLVWDRQHVVLLLPDNVWQPQPRVCLLITQHLGQETVLLCQTEMLLMCLAGYMRRDQLYLVCAGRLSYKMMCKWLSEVAALPAQL